MLKLKVLETSGSENDKHNKRHKYTLDEALQPLLEFIDETDYSDLTELELGLKHHSNDCNLQLVFVTNHRNSLMIATDMSNNYLLLKSY